MKVLGYSFARTAFVSFCSVAWKCCTKQCFPTLRALPPKTRFLSWQLCCSSDRQTRIQIESQIKLMYLRGNYIIPLFCSLVCFTYLQNDKSDNLWGVGRRPEILGDTKLLWWDLTHVLSFQTLFSIRAIYRFDKTFWWIVAPLIWKEKAIDSTCCFFMWVHFEYFRKESPAIRDKVETDTDGWDIWIKCVCIRPIDGDAHQTLPLS